MATVIIRTLLFILAICALTQAIKFQKNQKRASTSCTYVYGDWSQCYDDVQNRTVRCNCGDRMVDLLACYQVLPPPHPAERDCNVDTDEPEEAANLNLICKWKWSKWSDCSQECNGGNTTRSAACLCQGLVDAVDVKYCDLSVPREEVAPCNEFTCGEVPALNKLYWAAREEEYQQLRASHANLDRKEFWPIEDAVFNCSLGFDPADSPKGKTFSQVLADEEPRAHKHDRWYFLAKEYIACRLNQANGVQFSEEGLRIIDQTGKLLENCAGWEPVEVPAIYARKEKLGRLNNNIGGLSNVDQQVGLVGEDRPIFEDGYNNRTYLIVLIAVPLGAILMIILVLALSIHYVRDHKDTVIERAEFDSEDDEEEGIHQAVLPDSHNVPLEGEKQPLATGESSEEAH
jgi:hypothetical protein